MGAQDSKDPGSPNGSRDELDKLTQQVDRIEPWLRKRVWPPMSYMLIPSVLAFADRLIDRLEKYSGPFLEEAKALLARLQALRADFRRIPSGEIEQGTPMTKPNETEVARRIFLDRFSDKTMPFIMRGFRAEVVGGDKSNRRWRCTWDMECFEGSFCDEPKHTGEGITDVETTDAELARFGMCISDGKANRAGFDALLAHADPVRAAYEAAACAHATVMRKHGASNIEHQLRVARMVWEAIDTIDLDLVAAALLHAVLEDTATPEQELIKKVGTSAVSLVLEITRPMEMPREEYFEKFKRGEKSAKAVLLKLADRIDDLNGCVLQPDRVLAADYIRETETYLRPLAAGTPFKAALEGALAQARAFVKAPAGISSQPPPMEQIKREGVTFEVQTSRKEFAAALAKLKRSAKSKVPFEIILSFADGKLSVRGLGMVVEVPASGKAGADVHVESGLLMRLGKLLPNQDPLPMSASGDKLQLGSVHIPCTMSPQQPIELALPVNPELLDILALRFKLSPEDIERSGYKKALSEAEEKRDAMVKRAVAALKQLGVSEEDINGVVEESIRKSGGEKSGT